MFALTASAQAGQTRPLPFGGELPSASSLQTIFRSQVLESFAANRGVFWEGDPANDIFEVVRGILRLYRILPDGRRAIVGFIFAGDVIGLSFRDKYLFTAEAVTELGVRRFPRKRFHALVDETPELRPQLLSKLRDEMCAAQDQMLLLLHRTAEERVANFLLSVARRTSSGAQQGTQVHLPMSRTDIADYLGLTIETVCRTITKLKSDRLISLMGPHRVVLEKPRALGELAGEDGAQGDYEEHRFASSRAVWPN
jgi:CRP/FNR family transcriptional regulator